MSVLVAGGPTSLSTSSQDTARDLILPRVAAETVDDHQRHAQPEAGCLDTTREQYQGGAFPSVCRLSWSDCNTNLIVQ